MSAVRHIQPERLAEYQATALRRRERERQERNKREERAWEVARRVAALLKERFGATHVVVFGSLIRKGCFTLWSDVDLAAWGIRPEDTFRAVSAVIAIDPEITVNLVDIQTCRPTLRTVIEQEGVEL